MAKQKTVEKRAFRRGRPGFEGRRFMRTIKYLTLNVSGDNLQDPNNRWFFKGLKHYEVKFNDINLSNNGLDDIRFLEDAGCFKKVKAINFSNNNIREVSQSDLRVLKFYYPELRDVILINNPLTEESKIEIDNGRGVNTINVTYGTTDE